MKLNIENSPLGKHHRILSGCLPLFVLMIASSITANLSAGPQIRAVRGGGGFGGEIVLGGLEPARQESVNETEGAGLKTDPDLESLLKKAERYREDGNFRVAAKLWQAVLERSGDALYSEDDKIYYSLGQQVESIIAKLPPDGLRMYRITADASAKEIMAAASSSDRIGALSKIVKEYFVSSVGDDAAFELGNYYLDRFDFIGAIRLHKKIIDSYPDPSIDLSQVWLRLALAYAYVGNKQASDLALAEARKAAADPDTREFTQITSAIQNAEAYIKDSKEQQIWSMRLGNHRRTGVMPRFPLSLFDSDLQPIWTYTITPKNDHGSDSIQGEVSFAAATDYGSNAEKKTVELWLSQNWRPAGELLFSKDLMFYKTAADVTVWRKHAKSSEVFWRPLWLNRFEVDGSTEVWKNMRQYNNQGKFANNRLPKENYQIFHFGDEIHQTLSIYKGILFSVEGKEYSDTDDMPRRAQARYNWGTTPRRTRINNLTAYNVETGQFMWRYPPLDGFSNSTAEEKKPVDPADELEENEDVGVMGSPVGYGNLLLVPVNSGGSIWVHALDIENEGKRVWKSFLCDEPSTGSKAWASILMTLDGSDLYVSCGYGAFFVLDPATGSVRFARRYPRSGSLDQAVRNLGIQTSLMNLKGFSHDMLIPHGNHVVLLASDHNMIVGYDRQTGQQTWKAPSDDIFGTKVDYLIGVYDGFLYAGGQDNVIAYDLDGDGRMIWTIEHHLNGQTSDGRAMLTPEGVFVPVGQTIMHFDLKTGKLIKKVGVRLPGRSPVGNLYSDGEKLWIHNGNRVMALGSVPDPPAKEESKKTDEDGGENKKDDATDKDQDKDKDKSSDKNDK